jgi:hypothetical protein
MWWRAASSHHIFFVLVPLLLWRYSLAVIPCATELFATFKPSKVALTLMTFDNLAVQPTLLWSQLMDYQGQNKCVASLRAEDVFRSSF